MFRPLFALRFIRHSLWCWLFLSAVFLPALAACAEDHGLWVWKSPTVLQAPNAAASLLDFCKSEGITEIYVSISEGSEAAEEPQLVHLISLLHGSNIRVEALLSSTDADEPGKHRETLLRHVQGVLQFNQKHPSARFDGIHLDIEPQQRPENKVVSRGRCNTGLEFIRWRLKAQRLSWPLIQAQSNFIQV